jgi:hypothetical protein
MVLTGYVALIGGIWIRDTSILLYAIYQKNTLIRYFSENTDTVI